MQKGSGWVQIVCKIAYILNGRPLCHLSLNQLVGSECEFKESVFVFSSGTLASMQSHISQLVVALTPTLGILMVTMITSAIFIGHGKR